MYWMNVRERKGIKKYVLEETQPMLLCWLTDQLVGANLTQY